MREETEKPAFREGTERHGKAKEEKPVNEGDKEQSDETRSKRLQKETAAHLSYNAGRSGQLRTYLLNLVWKGWEQDRFSGWGDRAPCCKEFSISGKAEDSEGSQLFFEECGWKK